MIKRFVSAAAIASAVIFPLAIFMRLNPELPVESRYLLTTIWCLLPVIWGVWAVIMPKSLLLKHIPLWGALLGLIAGVVIVFVLRIPMQLMGEALTGLFKGVLLLAAIVLYYALWHLVKWLINKLE
jgi:hypothetical protein